MIDYLLWFNWWIATLSFGIWLGKCIHLQNSIWFVIAFFFRAQIIHVLINVSKNQIENMNIYLIGLIYFFSRDTECRNRCLFFVGVSQLFESGFRIS